MFFIASKIFWALARPLNVLFLLALVASLFAMAGRRRLAAILIALCAFLFAAIGFTQLPDFLLYQLETHAAQPALPPDPAGIIVLGGGLSAESAARPDSYRMSASADRLIRGLELKRRFPDTRLIYSGGLATLLQQGRPETQAARQIIEALYGDTRGVEFEAKSRNTWENAVFVARMAGADRSRPWILVTSAFHMPRALGCFREAGMNVIAAPADFRAAPLRFPFLTGDSAGQFKMMSILVKEWIGLVAYHLTGRTTEWLPR